MNEITPREAIARQRAGATLVDVRDANEWALGAPPGAMKISLPVVVEQLPRHIGDRGAEIVAICGSGKRSLRAIEALAAIGYANVRSVAGGTTRWQAEGLPWEAPDVGLDAEARERYSRHLLLAEVGLEGQRRLNGARVVLIGAGGLGAPVSLYLAAAGVGHLRIVDHDVVDRSNLQRQVIHTDARVGTPKTASAVATLSALNPRVAIEPVEQKLQASNVEALLRDADVVVDGSDNFPTRYLVNDACVALGKPLVYGAVQRFEGQAAVFHAAHPSGAVPCYRCLFPEPPAPEDAPNCAQAGVLGVLPGIVGLLQANETIKLILGIGAPLYGRLLMIDALGARFRELKVPRDPACPACGPGARRGVYRDYDEACASL